MSNAQDPLAEVIQEIADLSDHLREPCPTCGGTGLCDEDGFPCEDCGGDGAIEI